MFCVQNVGALQTLNPAWIYQGPADSWTPTTHIILLSIGARRETHFNPAAVVILQLSGLQDDGWMCSSLYVMLVLIIYVTFQEGFSPYFTNAQSFLSFNTDNVWTCDTVVII